MLEIAGNALLLWHKNKAGKTELVQGSAPEDTVLHWNRMFISDSTESIPAELQNQA